MAGSAMDDAAAASGTTAAGTGVESADSAYDNICGICFTAIHPIDNPRGKLNSCNHLFCSYCIKEWAKSTNVCPLCKARFTRIYTMLPEATKVQETKVRKKNYAAWDTAEDSDGNGESEASSVAASEAVACAVCGQSSNASRIIFCDRRQCMYAAHLDCLGLAERPLTFLCPSCTELRRDTDAMASSAHAEDDDRTSSPLSSSVTSSAPHDAAGHKTSVAQPPAPSPPRKIALPHRPPTDWFERLSRGALPRGAAADRVGEIDLTGEVQHAVAPSRTTTATSAATGAPSTDLRRARPADRTARDTIDLARCNLTATTPVPPPAGRASLSSSSSSSAPKELYFLAPSPHARAAMQELRRMHEERTHEADVRRERNEAKVRRLQRLYGTRSSSYEGIYGADAAQEDLLPVLPLPSPTPPRMQGGRGQGLRGKRARGVDDASLADLQLAQLASEERNYTDPQRRRLLEERLTREWARDIVPVLRRNRDIASNKLKLDDKLNVVQPAPLNAAELAAREATLWTQAVQQARVAVREKMDTNALLLRRRREHLVQLRAVREAAALAKLARIIASHRQREEERRSVPLPGAKKEEMTSLDA